MWLFVPPTVGLGRPRCRCGSRARAVPGGAMQTPSPCRQGAIPCHPAPSGWPSPRQPHPRHAGPRHRLSLLPAQTCHVRFRPEMKQEVLFRTPHTHPPGAGRARCRMRAPAATQPALAPGCLVNGGCRGVGTRSRGVPTKWGLHAGPWLSPSPLVLVIALVDQGDLGPQAGRLTVPPTCWGLSSQPRSVATTSPHGTLPGRG